MPNIATLTYGTLLAYVMPASIVALAFLPFYCDWLKRQWCPNLAGFFVLVFIGVSILVGFLINALATVVSIDLQQKARDLIFFWEYERPSLRKLIFLFRRKSDGPSVLSELMEELYPEYKCEQEKVKLVYAIFNFHVREYIYARRNWDWYFYQASRNTLMASFVSIFAPILAGFRPTWYWAYTTVGLVLTIVVLYLFALRQLEIYYGFYANVVLGHLLELKQSAQAVGSDRPMAGTGKTGGN
jgi:hypothetical protein